ncbi:hypothetical protein [Azospirillum argentinense]|uniref:Uncharacterized protein n=1 Tax=Azospirillum argentinense TaxID=2970906 RepID=A0A5B0KX82_9PROT|nr:hypothetical protein [Azospirillum argentinense]KAA1057202.1 hypothetical protein FH063_001370 [Azospirillum argentinense]
MTDINDIWDDEEDAQTYARRAAPEAPRRPAVEAAQDLTETVPAITDDVAVQSVAEQVERRVNERGGEAELDEIVALTIEVLWEGQRAAARAVSAPAAAHAEGLASAPAPREA